MFLKQPLLRVLALKLPGIHVVAEMKRFYPEESLAAAGTGHSGGGGLVGLASSEGDP